MAVGPASVALAVRQRILVSMAAGQPMPGAGVLTPRDE
jgi:hypothetical protein